ncbi:MAG: oligosaccharide flippase family protein [Anaerolineales bacterium]|nr:oligosaccharide flippase family protein [Anaerolineales bacterium]
MSEEKPTPPSGEVVQGIARHTVKGSAYSVSASVVTLGLGVARKILMVRWLFPDVVGLGSVGLLWLDLVTQIGTIGIHNAFVHRKEVDDNVRATYFTMNLGLTAVSLLVLGALLPVITRFYPQYPQLVWVILAYMGVEVIKTLNLPQMTMMSKNLAFGRLALIDVVSSVVMTLVGPMMAWMGFGVWSILGETLSGVLVRGFMLWVVYRPWKPRLGWDRDVVRWFWDYGIKAWWSTNLTYVLNNFDELWTSSFLGLDRYGLYANAYDFATYSRKVVATPILSVFFPTFAHLQTDKLRLSRAFFRATSLMVRMGGLFSLLFILTAPEFIRLFLKPQWIPMQLTFQLMIVYTLFDPLSLAAQNLLMATGLPGAVLRARIIQTAIFIPAVIGLSIVADIEGVALATDLMILVGAVLLFRDTYRVAAYSSRALWLWPLVGIGLSAGIVFALNPLWAGLSLWVAFAAKLVLIPLLYGGFLFLTEREQLLTGWNMLWGMVKRKA